MSSAVFIRKVGGPEVLSFEEISAPSPGQGEVAIRQTAIGVNFIDTYQRTGLYKVELPFIGGQEGVGVVTAIGAAVTSFKEGDRVAYSGQNGAYAADRVIKADRAVKVPDGLDDKVVAGALLKGTTAYYLVHLTHEVKAGDTLLVHAAAGGTGSLIAQWASAKGARVIGTAGGPEKVAKAKENGCSDVIDYRAAAFAPTVKELTGGRGVDVIYDGVGKVTFEPGLDCLKPRGLMVSFGNASGVVSIPDLTILARKGSLYVTRPTTASYFQSAEDYRTAANAVLKALSDGTLRAEVNQTFALRDAAEAHKALESRGTTGQTVLIP
jgi:NADPH2:quinone reductase